MSKKLYTFAGLFVVLSLLLAACGGAATPAPAAPPAQATEAPAAEAPAPTEAPAARQLPMLLGSTPQSPKRPMSTLGSEA